MNIIVPRTCTEISAGNEDQHREKESRPLEAFRDTPAYALLGDPGAGKTTAFEAERKALGEKAYLITARDFLTFDPQSHPEWSDKTLFIDGLDETRVGANDARTPFDQIHGRLDALGKPRFRLSCREADWLGANDQKHLESVSPDSKVTVLRLNPLTDSDIADILNDRSDIGDAQAFIALAQERRVYELLKNPQTLKMLADVVTQGGGWPKSRKETFEIACGQMVREHNEEHQAAQASNSPPAPAQLLDAAGRLCAVQLISGAAGYTNTLRGQPSEGYPTLDQCGYDSPEMLRPALATKLFKGASNNRFTPIHRHIAEFLGARHLARIIEKDLPARRVIALIEGKDGTVVTEMRGLSAWLAALCEDARADLIERDPIGVGLYGDIREFSTDEKRALLESLNREGIRLDSVWRTAAAFGALATPDMEPALRAILTDPSREKEHQLFTDFVLRVLREGERLPRLSELLLEIVRDDTRCQDVNYAALNAFIHNCPDSPQKTGKLKELLADIHAGSLPDTDNQLLGALLTQLYPDDLPPSEVWDYFTDQGDPNFIGRYTMFWEIDLLESSDELVAELLDHLHERLPDLQPVLDVRRLNDLPLRLLACGLKTYGDQLDTEHLYDWLSARSERMRNSLDDQAIQEIHSWLEQRPNIYKAILMEGLSRCPESDEFRRHAIKAQNHLYGASPPSDFGLWCLRQADALADTKPLIAEHLFMQAFKKGLSLEVLQEHTQRNETSKAYLDRLLDSIAKETEFKEQWQQKEQQQEQERQQQQEQWLAYIRSNKDALSENRAEPALLYTLALVYFGHYNLYFGHFYDLSGDDGPEIIAKLLRGDRALIDATLLGLQGVIDREDVPDINEILSLRERDRIHDLSLPFLAGLEELERTVPEEDPSRWSDDRIRKAIAFYYCTDYRPEWYRRLLAARPEIVAEVQKQFAICEFRGGRERIYKLFELAHDPDHAQVAQYASLPLLRAFPIRCKLKQIQSLDYLLWAAIQHADRSSLQELIERKLSRKSMNAAQRGHWLAAGIIISPNAYNDLLRDFVQYHERLVPHLAEFFPLQDRVLFSFDELEIPLLELLIRLVGSYVGPGNLRGDESEYVGHKIKASKLVRLLIQNLAASSTKDASGALAALLADPELSAWSDVLSQAQDAQRVTWRDASYRHHTIEQVCQTLNDGTPANAADLAALLVDRFDEIADRISTNNANYWRPYWNEDKNQKPTTPKHENSCRDALLRDLRLHFPNSEPEVQYINKKRVDIRVSYGNFQVPVEIKKNSHQELWSSLRNQLIAQYTIDSNTDGYGIYLVFWFGKDRTQPPPSGTRPTNAEELKKRLESTLSPDEARKISVCVIDVSRPD
ncbi:MAG: hypothetical protein OXI72_11535 [Gemmatimonadota bacterium]|nr:hypothetical protein [Gemmatimonadota bacterium]